MVGASQGTKCIAMVTVYLFQVFPESPCTQVCGYWSSQSPWAEQKIWEFRHSSNFIVNNDVAMAMGKWDRFPAYLWAVSNVMVFPTIEAFDGHSPQPEEHKRERATFKIVTLFSEKRDRGLNVLTASPHSGSVCQPRTVPYTPENSYVGQGQHQRIHHPCN